MIEFHYETNFRLKEEKYFADWVNRVLISEKSKLGQIDYIFCEDEFLLGLNVKFLKHDTYTDIITFDYSENDEISGDIFISIERVAENATIYKSFFEDELRRVMAHGVLHLVGYADKSETDSGVMRDKENEKIKMFHVEQ